MKTILTAIVALGLLSGVASASTLPTHTDTTSTAGYCAPTYWGD